MSDNPLLYQMNTRVRLTELSKVLGRRATLKDITDEELDTISAQGFEWVWLLSIWQTGPVGECLSRSNSEWRSDFEQTLPDLQEDDIAGSGFAIADYNVHSDLGGNTALTELRSRLAKRKLKLMLDFVPNHTALDHSWVFNHPEYYVVGTEQDLLRSPNNYIRIETIKGEVILAHGRDPYFPGWPDTAQLDYSNPATQLAIKNELMRISQQCEGVRCDMAMLVLPDVFERTWSKPTPRFWTDVINEVRKNRPEFCFMAEAYWDREWSLQQEGFDYAYDKRLYDRLRDGDAASVRDHLRADMGYQSKLTRFIENHDEPRAAATFSLSQHKAAAIITYLSPGLRFFHQGQFEGRTKRISPHLVRAPEESVNAELFAFYTQLLSLLQHPVFRDGKWQLLEALPAWDSNWTNECFVAFEWDLCGTTMVVVINYASNQSQCYLRLPLSAHSQSVVRFADSTSQAVYDRGSADLGEKGLYLDMEPWQFHVFTLSSTNLADNLERAKEAALCGSRSLPIV